jgi:oligopeptide/dipeptide ABC transporter ATP-binding protein
VGSVFCLRDSYSFCKYKKVVRDISFDLIEGEILGILGESGSGKSTVGWAMMGMIEEPHKIKGQILFESKENVLKYSESKIELYRWSKTSMIFQTSMNSFDPLVTIGKNFTGLLLEKGIADAKEEARRKTIQLLKEFNLPDSVYNLFPFELSGGMKQRVCISMALSCSPSVLIADEPTTALDTVSQFGVINSLKEIMQTNRVKSMIFITHDTGVQYIISDKIMIMLGGKIVEYGTKDDIYKNPKHPYTTYLLSGLLPNNNDISAKVANPYPDSTENNQEKGCPFSKLCSFSIKECYEDFPGKTYLSDSHYVYCYLYG